MNEVNLDLQEIPGGFRPLCDEMFLHTAHIQFLFDERGNIDQQNQWNQVRLSQASEGNPNSFAARRAKYVRQENTWHSTGEQLRQMISLVKKRRCRAIGKDPDLIRHSLPFRTRKIPRRSRPLSLAEKSCFFRTPNFPKRDLAGVILSPPEEEGMLGSMERLLKLQCSTTP